jgi:hypothetical protein
MSERITQALQSLGSKSSENFWVSAAVADSCDARTSCCLYNKSKLVCRLWLLLDATMRRARFSAPALKRFLTPRDIGWRQRRWQRAKETLVLDDVKWTGRVVRFSLELRAN